MHLCPDHEFEWIKDERSKPVPRKDQNGPGNSLSVLLPPHFEAYSKILTEMRSFVETKRGREGPRIRWRELADFLCVPFEPQICHKWFFASMSETACWSRFLYGPAEGNLDHEELSEIVSILRPFTGGQECFLRFAEIPLTGTDKPRLFSGALNEVIEFGKENDYRFSPEYLWPSDRSWCLCSDFDFEFTFVGGPQELISAILASRELEAFQITPQTRVDYLVPVPKSPLRVNRSR
jgi:hypothetical protein